MINSMQKALIVKDIKAITSNKRLFSVLLIVPLVMVVVIPSIFLLSIGLAPTGDADFQSIMALLPAAASEGDTKQVIASVILNNIVSLFFLLIPIMASSVMAASSFVGEKEKRTLETLLYTPLTLRQIFISKVLASFILSMLVSVLSFVAMFLVVEIESYFVFGSFITPDISWLVIMLLVSPAISVIAITLIVRGSAKAKTVEESQQRSVFLVLPIVLLVGGQFAGLLLINVWMLLGAGAIFAVIAWIMLRMSFSGFTYESLL